MNEVFEIMADAFGELRCESEDRKYSVQTEELKKAEKKLKQKNKAYQKWSLDLLENDRLFLEDYPDAVGHVHYQEEQRAYYSPKGNEELLSIAYKKRSIQRSFCVAFCPLNMLGRAMCSERLRGYFYISENLPGFQRGKVLL